MTPEELFLSQLPVIDAIVGHVARRHHLPASEAEELASVVRFKLVERDYAILRKFAGRSSVRTYLTTVVQRLFLDYRIEAWGKWRPCAAARRMGPVAVRLDQLVNRDGLTFDEAAELLRTNHGVDVSRDELLQMTQEFPQRVSRRAVGEECMATIADESALADATVLDQDRQHTAARASEALQRAMSELPPIDQVMVRMRFKDGFSVAEIARALHIEQKPLYRKLEQALRQLRTSLERQGLGAADLSALVGHADVELNLVFAEGKADPRPSIR